MKKILSFALVALMAGFMLSSCQKTAEEKFVGDVQELYQTTDAASDAYARFIEKTAQMQKKYEVENLEDYINSNFQTPITKDFFKGSKIKNLSKDQIQKLNNIRKKFLKLTKEQQKKYKELQEE